jgi:hypothetical protein
MRKPVVLHCSPLNAAGFVVNAGLSFPVNTRGLAHPSSDPPYSHSVPAIRHHSDAPRKRK